MATYKNLTQNSPLTAVEFSPVSDGNFSFFYVADSAKKADVKEFVESLEPGQNIIAETTVGGQPVLITRGDKNQDEMIKALEERGEKLELVVHKKPFNYWALRGGLSVVGQTLHLASAILGVEKVGKGHARLDPNNAHFNPKLKEGMYVRKAFQKDIGVFALLNQTANLANIVYGGQKESGDNRLHAVKEEINKTLSPELLIDDEPISVSENRSKLRAGPQAPLTAMQKTDALAREYSVRFFEIGLRVLGTTALIVPWKKASFVKGLSQLQKGDALAAWKAVKNPDKNYFWAGTAYMTGKALSFSAKVPDPYEDKPHTQLDTLREKYLFKVGTGVETVAATLMAHNAFTRKKFGFSDPNRPDIKPNTDYLSGIGGSAFAIAFIARMFAPFGAKHVEMEEVYAHAADTLAKTPTEKLPQLMADTSAMLKEHFKDKPEIEFGSIFTKMMADMYRYHHKALGNLGTEPQEQAEKPASAEPETAAEPRDGVAAARRVLAHAPHAARTPLAHVTAPAGSHQDALAVAPSAAQGLGV